MLRGYQIFNHLTPWSLEFQTILAWNYFHWYPLQGGTSFVLFVLFWKISCTKFTMNMSSLRYGDASVLPSIRLIDHYSQVSKTSSPYYWGGLIVIKFNHNSREMDRYAIQMVFMQKILINCKIVTLSLWKKKNVDAWSGVFLSLFFFF